MPNKGSSAKMTLNITKEKLFYPFHVQHRDCFFAGTALKKFHVLPTILEHILSQDCRALRMPQQVQVAFEIRFLWSVEQTNLLTNKILLSRFIQVVCQQIRFCNSRSGICRPSRSFMPLTIGTSSIDVDRDEDDIADTYFIAYGIYPAASFSKRNIGNFRYQKLSIVAAIIEFCCDAGGDKAVIFVFEKEPVWAAFAGRFDAVAIVEKNFHSRNKTQKGTRQLA